MKLTFGFFALLCLFSCTKYTYVYETQALNSAIIKNDKGFYVYENDTVKIVYSFWSDKGILAFSLYNKLNVPLYINWKRSSFVQNENKLDYWREESITKSTTRSRGVSATGIGVSNSALMPLLALASSAHVSVTNQVTVIPEKITFMAPHSSIYKANFYLYNLKGVSQNRTWKQETINYPSYPNKPDKKIQVKTSRAIPSNTPINFRNFLTISTSEDFNKEGYIDNPFYVSSIVKVKTQKTWYSGYNREEYRVEKVFLFYNPAGFYVDIK